jgi:hypothetical protein
MAFKYNSLWHKMYYLQVPQSVSLQIYQIFGERFGLCRIKVKEKYCKGNFIGIQETRTKCDWSECCKHNWPAVNTTGKHPLQNINNAAAFDMCPQVVTLAKPDYYQFCSLWLFICYCFTQRITESFFFVHYVKIKLHSYIIRDSIFFILNTLYRNYVSWRNIQWPKKLLGLQSCMCNHHLLSGLKCSEVAIGQVFIRLFQFSPLSTIPPMSHLPPTLYNFSN